MTKFKKVLFGVLGLYVFAALSLAQAQNAPGDEMSSAKLQRGQRIQEIYNQLDLTDSQKQQLDANKQQHRAKMKAARQAMKINEEALQTELMKAQLDMTRINDIHQQIKAVQSQIEDERLNSILAVRAILTPDQFLKFVTLMHKHKEGHKE